MNCLVTGQDAVPTQESSPNLRLAWSYGETREASKEIHGFIVYMGKTKERDPITNPYPIKHYVLLPETIANPPSYGSIPPIAIIAKPDSVTSNVYIVDIGEISRGEYYTVVTAFKWQDDGSIIEGEPSNEIGLMAYTVSVTESADTTNWTYSFSKSFIDQFDPKYPDDSINKKFFNIQFKVEDYPVIPSVPSPTRKVIVPYIK